MNTKASLFHQLSLARLEGPGLSAGLAVDL